MYLLKSLPEDFKVKEIPSLELKPTGKYIYFRLTKKNLNTLDAVKVIAKQLHIAEKQIGFAGSKDKKAVTEQVCSVIGVKRERLLALQIKDVAIEFVGYADVPISLGDLQGNYFEIVVRSLDKTTKIKKLNCFPNYFDEQRFGRNNAEIGQALVKKEFKRVVELLNSPQSSQLHSLSEHLAHHPQDYVGALLQLPIRQLRLYLNAYQSKLWNAALGEYLGKKGTVIREIPYSQGVFVFTKKNFPKLKVPLIGFGTESLVMDKEVRKIITQIMEKENISFSDFIIKQIPPLTLEGEMRKAFVGVEKLKMGKLEKDELHAGKYKVVLSFTLPKGSYATMAVKGMMGG